MNKLFVLFLLSIILLLLIIYNTYSYYKESCQDNDKNKEDNDDENNDENNDDENDDIDDDEIPQKIWLFWHKPLNDNDENDNNIKFCYDIIKKLCPHYQINFLNLENYKSYIKDNRVIDIINNDNLLITHKSDIIRLYLIYNYGGIYLDSSIILFDSLDWIYQYNKYDVIMYKNIHHTTNSIKPVLENWFIAAKPKNSFIKNVLEKSISVLKNNIEIELIKLKMDKDVNYQNFINHGSYHIVYFVFIYVLYKTYKTNLPNILFLECNTNKLTCSSIMTTEIKDNFIHLFTNPITDEEYNKIKEEKMVKLTRKTRSSINELKEKISKNSFINRLLF